MIVLLFIIFEIVIRHILQWSFLTTLIAFIYCLILNKTLYLLLFISVVLDYNLLTYIFLTSIIIWFIRSIHFFARPMSYWFRLIRLKLFFHIFRIKWFQKWILPFEVSIYWRLILEFWRALFFWWLLSFWMLDLMCLMLFIYYLRMRNFNFLLFLLNGFLNCNCISIALFALLAATSTVSTTQIANLNLWLINMTCLKSAQLR